MSEIPKLLLIIDGMADCPIPELNDQTPMQAAKIPVMDRLASEGEIGLADPIEPETTATTVTGSLAILGYDPFKYSIGRGVIEAMGCGTKVHPGDVALRGNWATLDDKGLILDRRAGRIRHGTEELAASISGMDLGNGVTVDVAASTEHRLAIVIHGQNLNACVKGSDPGDASPIGVPPNKARSLNPKNENCQTTADFLNQFEQQARKILQNHPVNLEREKQGLFPANSILSREPGEVDYVPFLKHPSGRDLQGICIAGENTIAGISHIAGMEVCQNAEMTANLDTNLREKFRLAGEYLSQKDVVLLHIKGCDIAAHNKDPLTKRDFMEKIDQELGNFLEGYKGDLKLVITTDHSTSSNSGAHFDDPVPVLIHGNGIESDSVQSFDEFTASSGALGRFQMCTLWGKLFSE